MKKWKWQQSCPAVLSPYSYITSLTLIEWLMGRLVSYTMSALLLVCHYNTNISLTVYFEVFWKSILKKYFQNTILFCISNIFFESILFCIFKKLFCQYFIFVFSKYFSKVFFPTLPKVKKPTRPLSLWLSQPITRRGVKTTQPLCPLAVSRCWNFSVYEMAKWGPKVQLNLTPSPRVTRSLRRPESCRRVTHLKWWLSAILNFNQPKNFTDVNNWFSNSIKCSHNTDMLQSVVLQNIPRTIFVYLIILNLLLN